MFSMEECRKIVLEFINGTENREFAIKKCFECLYQKTGYRDIALEALVSAKEIKLVEDYVIYTGDKDLTKEEQLQRIGATTIKIYEEKDLDKLEKGFINTLRSFPSYKRHPKNPDLNPSGKEITYVLGGFAALGNPGSFHNPYVRSIRKNCREKVEKLLRSHVLTYNDKKLREGYNLEMLYDRMMYRKAGQKAVAEAWHRDVMVKNMILPDDEIFGGWINLSRHPQYFSFIPGSHLNIRQYDIPHGFDTLEKRETAKAKKLGKDPKKHASQMKKLISKYRYKLVIPPGHLCIFPQYIMHEVVAKAVNHDMIRLFTGWRLTLSKNNLYDNDAIMDAQSVVPLPGSMIPPMYSKNHSTCFLGVPTISKLSVKKSNQEGREQWVKAFVKDINLLHPTKTVRKLTKDLDEAKGMKRKMSVLCDMVQHYSKDNPMIEFDCKHFMSNPNHKISLGVFKTNPKDNKTKTNLIKWSEENMKNITTFRKKYKKNQGEYTLVDRHMKSLLEYEFPMYEEYNDKERLLYTPLNLFQRK